MASVSWDQTWRSRGPCPEPVPPWAAAVCPPPGKEQTRTWARIQLGSAGLVLSSACTSCPQLCPWGHLLPHASWAWAWRGLGPQVGAGREKEGGLMARSGEPELQNGGCREWGGQLPALRTCHQAQVHPGTPCMLAANFGSLFLLHTAAHQTPPSLGIPSSWTPHSGLPITAWNSLCK